MTTTTTPASASTSTRESASDARDRLIEEIRSAMASFTESQQLEVVGIIESRGEEFGSRHETSADIWDSLRDVELNKGNAGAVLGCLRAIRRDFELIPERDRQLTECTSEMEKVMVGWLTTLGRFYHPFTTLEISDLFSGDVESQGKRIGVFLAGQAKRHDYAKADKAEFDAARRQADKEDTANARETEIAPTRERLMAAAETQMAKMVIWWLAYLGCHYHPFTTLSLDELFTGDTESREKRIGVFLHRKGAQAKGDKRKFDADRREAQAKDRRAATEAKRKARSQDDPMSKLLASSQRPPRGARRRPHADSSHRQPVAAEPKAPSPAPQAPSFSDDQVAAAMAGLQALGKTGTDAE